MTTRMARTRLLKIVRLRPAARSFSGKVSPSRSRPITRISPVSMRAFGLPRPSPSDMAVQHHPEELHASVEQCIGKSPGHALRGAGGVHDEQDAVEGAPKAGGGEHLSHHRRVEQDHVPVLFETSYGPGDLWGVREPPRTRQDRAGRKDPQVRRSVEAVAVEATAPLQSTGETGKVRPAEPTM